MTLLLQTLITTLQRKNINSLIAAAQEDGAAGVDITSDNQSAIDAAIADLPYNFTEQEYYDLRQELFDLGVASVDITTDNQAAFDEGSCFC